MKPLWTSSTAASLDHAKISLLLVAARAWRESEAAYFSRSSAWSMSYDRPSSTWRTSQQSLFGGSKPSSKKWSGEGMTVGGRYYPLRTSERRTCGRDGGYWPTATATDAKGSRRATVPGYTDNSHAGTTLTDFVWMYPTPTAQSYGTNHGGAAGKVGPVRPSLETMARKNLWPTPKAHAGANRRQKPTPAQLEGKAGWDLSAAVKYWPTPRASDGEKGGPNQRGSKGDLMLSSAVHMWPTPTAADGTGGPGCSGRDGGENLSGRDGGENLRTAAGGSLAPNFVEFLMGYPKDWTKISSWADPHVKPNMRGKRRRDDWAAGGRNGPESPE